MCLKALLVRGLGELGVHLGPLVVLAGGGELQVLGGGADLAARHVLIPELGVLLLVIGSLGEEGSYLLVAVLLGLRGIKLIFHAGLGLPGKGVGEILIGLAVLELHYIIPP